jgi:hypothetical protein
MSVADRISALTPEQRALFERLRERERESRPAVRLPPPVRRVSGPAGVGDWPLSFDQERLWQLHRDHPGLVSWNVDAGSRVVGDLDVPAFLAAFREVVRRHAAWRTTFPLAPIPDGQPVQRVAAQAEPELSLLDVTALPPALRGPAGHRAVYDHTRAPFDLARGPLVRLALVRIAEREHLVLLTVHHTVTDWITFQICLQELAVLYEACRAGRPSPLPDPPVQFPDFAVWEREWLQGEILAEQAGFWRRELAGFPLVLELPEDRPRPPVQSQRGGMFRVRTGKEPADRLRALARSRSATSFMAVLALYGALLRRFTGQQRIVVGSNSANRARPELEPVIGFFLTQVPFALDLSGDPTVRELVDRARRAALVSYTHQSLPFSQLVAALQPDAGPERNPVLQALLLVLEGQGSQSWRGLELHPVGLFDGNSRWDLMLGVYDYPDAGFTGPLEYNADIFDPTTVGRLVELFYRLLEAAGADPDTPLLALPAFGDTARGQLIAGESIAGGIAGDLEDLGRRSARLVPALRRLGVGPGVRVALLLADREELAAAALAVRRAGGSCLALQVTDPAVRLAALLGDAGLALLIDDGDDFDGEPPAGLAPPGARRVPFTDLAGSSFG